MLSGHYLLNNTRSQKAIERSQPTYDLSKFSLAAIARSVGNLPVVTPSNQRQVFFNISTYRRVVRRLLSLHRGFDREQVQLAYHIEEDGSYLCNFIL